MIDPSTLLAFGVISAPDRARRPSAFAAAPPEECPFCPGAEDQTPPPLMIRGGDRWELRVVPNLYPIVPAGPHGPRHEVVIETAAHDGRPASWSHGRTVDVVSVWMERLALMHQRADVEIALMFRNQGTLGGASLSHPHSHVIGLPAVPPAISARNDEHCLVCEDLARSTRVLESCDGLVAWCPENPAFPWEIAITSTRHTGTPWVEPSFPEAIALLLTRAIRAYESRDLRDQNWILTTAPGRASDSLHWTLSLHPRVSAIAGFEIATGILVNVIDADTAWRDLSPGFSGA